MLVCRDVLGSLTPVDSRVFFGFRASHIGRLQGVENQRKCQLAVCGCRTREGSLYCSDDCQQAASQAIARDFCQCAHEGCEKPVYHTHADNAINLSDAISSAPGWLMIEYSSLKDLHSQLLLLAQSIDNQSKETLPLRADTTLRRGPATERGTTAQKAQSA